MIVIDVPHVFRVTNGPRGLLDLFAKYEPDLDLLYNAVQMWQQRGKIPSTYVGLILYCMEREGRACHEFFRDTSEQPHPEPTPKPRARPRR